MKVYLLFIFFEEGKKRNTTPLPDWLTLNCRSTTSWPIKCICDRGERTNVKALQEWKWTHTARLLPRFIMSYSIQESRLQTSTLDAYLNSSVYNKVCYWVTFLCIQIWILKITNETSFQLFILDSNETEWRNRVQMFLLRKRPQKSFRRNKDM